MGLDFCSECGNSLQAVEAFCANCGHRFESQQTMKQHVEGAQVTTAPQRSRTPQKTRMSKKKKIVIGIVAVIAIALFSAHIYIKSIISIDKQIASIYEALHEGNGDKFLEVVHVDDNVIFDPEAYMGLLELGDVPVLVEEIVAAIQQAEKTGLPQFISTDFVNNILKIERKKYLGIYNEIKIAAPAYEVKVETDLPSGKITIGDKEWEIKGEPIILGSFLPGNYSAILSNEELDDATLEWDILVSSNSKDNVLVIEKDAYMVRLAQENLDGLLIIDGKETGKKVSEMPQIGPLFTKTPIELSIVKEINGEQQQSAIVEAYPGDEVSFIFEIKKVEKEVASSTDSEEVASSIDLEEDDATKKALTENEITEENKQFVLDFRSAYEDALNTRDFSLVTPFLLEEGTAYEELEEFVGDMKNENYKYNFTHNETAGWEVNPDGGMEIDTYEVFDFINDKGHLTHYKRDKTYYLILDSNGDYKIDSILIRDTVRK